MAEIISNIVNKNKIDVISVYRKDEEGNPSDFNNLADIIKQYPVGSTEYKTIANCTVEDPTEIEVLEGSNIRIFKCKNIS